MNYNIKTIRDALSAACGVSQELMHDALAALAELERAAKEPVAWRFRVAYGTPWQFSDRRIINGDEPLSPAPPAPVSEIREVEVTDEMAERAYISKWRGVPELIDHEPDDEDRQWAREWLSAWRAELGPTLGLVEIREPTPDECERISMAYYDDETLVDRDHYYLGKDMFASVRAVMWPKS